MKKTIATALAAITLASGLVSPAAALGDTRIGILNCRVDGGDGFVFGSSKSLTCIFDPIDQSYGTDRYSGVISKFGIDVGTTSSGVITWAVLAASFDAYQPGALTGTYTGASAEVTAALGVGANVMIGPDLRTFTLQPVSAGAQSGLNLAVGIAELQLVPATK
jgi:hypothetical protein